MSNEKGREFDKRFKEKEEELKGDDFCGYKCTLCGGGVQNCVPILLMRIEDLEEQNKVSSNMVNELNVSKVFSDLKEM